MEEDVMSAPRHDEEEVRAARATVRDALGSRIEAKASDEFCLAVAARAPRLAGGARRGRGAPDRRRVRDTPRPLHGVAGDHLGHLMTEQGPAAPRPAADDVVTLE
jgi:hypothetical protein